MCSIMQSLYSREPKAKSKDASFLKRGVKDEQHAEGRRGCRPQERDRGRGERQGLLRVQGSCHPEEGKVKKSGQSSATQGDCRRSYAPRASCARRGASG